LGAALFGGSGPVRAQYPLPASAGFHHCALVYYRAVRGQNELMPLVARSENGKAKDWLFDAFLFLDYSSPRSFDTLTGPTIRSDWQFQLDNWFRAGRDLAALDAAVESVKPDIGAPPSKREVILAIPYLNPSVRTFGDVDGTGRSADLSTASGRDSVLSWYVREARRRFVAANYKHLHLWGFYWMREDMPAGDEPIVRQAANAVHAAGDRFLWIPYFEAAGWNRWREVGLDVAMMQSVYAFTFAHHGDVRRNRLAVTASESLGNGLGAEIECGDIVREPRDRYYFRCYLADGAPNRLGYQAAATAYYLGDDLVDQMLASGNAEVRSLYDALADYVAGRVVPDPDPEISWTSPESAPLSNNLLSGGRPVRTATTKFPKPTAVSRLDLFFDEPSAARVWKGIVQVEVMRPESSEWTAGGWAMRTAYDPVSRAWQPLTIPIGQTVAGMRVTFRPLAGSGLPQVRACAPEYSSGERTHFHLAQYRPYQILPAPAAAYPDDGRKLIDGDIPNVNFLGGKGVGWLRTDAAVHFDLGRTYNVSSLEVHCQGGGLGAVNWPAFAGAALSRTDPPPALQSARGPLPTGTQWILPDPLQIDSVRKPDDMNGHLTFSLERPTRARFVTFFLKPDIWLMLTEIRIFADGVNVAPLGKYSLSPLPTSNAEPKAWADDGHMLTDGSISSEGGAGQITGWDTGDWRDVVIDLGYSQAVHSVTVWSLGGGKAGIYAPKEASLAVSSDGDEWKMTATAVRPKIVEDGKILKPAAYRIECPPDTMTRYVRVRVRRAEGWAMLSEIVVE